MVNGKRSNLANKTFRLYNDGSIVYHIPVSTANRRAIYDSTEALRKFYVQALRKHANESFIRQKRAEYKDKILSLLHARGKEHAQTPNTNAHFMELIMEHYDIILGHVQRLIDYYNLLGEHALRDLWRGVYTKLKGVSSHGKLNKTQAQSALRILYRLDFNKEVEFWKPLKEAIANEESRKVAEAIAKVTTTEAMKETRKLESRNPRSMLSFVGFRRRV